MDGALLTGSAAQWTQPPVPGDSRYTNYQAAPDASFWTGIGVTELVQAGVDSIATSKPTYRFWTEDYPLGTDWEGPTVSPGNQVWVSVQYNGDKTATYDLENLTSGAYSAFTNPAPYWGNKAANYINERLGSYQQGYYLPHFSYSPSFQNAEVWVNPQYPQLLFEGTEWIMTTTGSSTGTVQSQPSAINNNDGFDVYWRHS